SADHHDHILSVGQHLQDVLDGFKVVYSYRDNGVVLGKPGELNATFVHCRQHHRGGGKELWPVMLNEGGRRRTDAYNDVGRLCGQERPEIRYEGNVSVLIG